MGEFKFIDSITNNTIFDKSSVKVGIGDDCAVCTNTSNMDTLISTDMMVEGIHFTDKTAAPFDVGYRLASANISDIAAMGGYPKQIVLSLALSKNLDTKWVQEVYRGLKMICQRYKVNIVGGDTVSTTGPVVLSLTIIGEVPVGEAVLRSGAKVGDYIGITNYLGLSRVGLETLLKEEKDQMRCAFRYAYSQEAHQRPEPQVELGILLRKHGAHAMNDISDGLASELNEIAKASNVQLVIEEEQIPIHEEISAWSKNKDKAELNRPVDYVLYGGEDFQLVFTIGQKGFDKLKNKSHIHFIGRVQEGPTSVFATCSDGTSYKVLPHGYNHFKEED